jgi:hypothetical protein
MEARSSGPPPPGVARDVGGADMTHGRRTNKRPRPRRGALPHFEHQSPATTYCPLADEQNPAPRRPFGSRHHRGVGGAGTGSTCATDPRARLRR